MYKCSFSEFKKKKKGQETVERIGQLNYIQTQLGNSMMSCEQHSS